MPKALTITPTIRAAIVKSTGDAEFDTSKVTAFETISFNTLPIKKRGLFNGARATESTLQEMADYVTAGGFVPLHTMHEQASELPIGRVFNAEVITNEKGLKELRSQFFINNEHTKLVSGVDTGSIDEVSIGLQTKHLNCSVCGFDYLGEESTADNVWGYVCNEGHVIGENGTHVSLSGMDRWLEQSLVSLGAANGAKILPRTKSLLGAETYEKLAASGVTPEATVVFASLPLNPEKPEQNMDLKEAVTLNAQLSGEKAVALHQVTTLTASLNSANETIKKKDEEITALTAKLAATPTDAVKTKADLDAVTETAKAQLAYVRKEADRLAVASGSTKLADSATFAELTASIEENRVKLSASFEGKSHGSDAGTGDDKTTASSAPSAYKTVK